MDCENILNTQYTQTHTHTHTHTQTHTHTHTQNACHAPFQSII